MDFSQFPDEIKLQIFQNTGLPEIAKAARCGSADIDRILHDPSLNIEKKMDQKALVSAMNDLDKDILIFFATRTPDQDFLSYLYVFAIKHQLYDLLGIVELRLEYVPERFEVLRGILLKGDMAKIRDLLENGLNILFSEEENIYSSSVEVPQKWFHSARSRDNMEMQLFRYRKPSQTNSDHYNEEKELGYRRNPFLDMVEHLVEAACESPSLEPIAFLIRDLKQSRFVSEIQDAIMKVSCKIEYFEPIQMLFEVQEASKLGSFIDRLSGCIPCRYGEGTTVENRVAFAKNILHLIHKRNPYFHNANRRLVEVVELSIGSLPCEVIECIHALFPHIDLVRFISDYLRKEYIRAKDKTIPHLIQLIQLLRRISSPKKHHMLLLDLLDLSLERGEDLETFYFSLLDHGKGIFTPDDVADRMVQSTDVFSWSKMISTDRIIRLLEKTKECGFYLLEAKRFYILLAALLGGNDYMYTLLCLFHQYLKSGIPFPLEEALGDIEGLPIQIPEPEKEIWRRFFEIHQNKLASYLSESGAAYYAAWLNSWKDHPPSEEEFALWMDMCRTTPERSLNIRNLIFKFLDWSLPVKVLVSLLSIKWNRLDIFRKLVPHIDTELDCASETVSKHSFLFDTSTALFDQCLSMYDQAHPGVDDFMVRFHLGRILIKAAEFGFEEQIAASYREQTMDEVFAGFKLCCEQFEKLSNRSIPFTQYNIAQAMQYTGNVVDTFIANALKDHPDSHKTLEILISARKSMALRPSIRAQTSDPVSDSPSEFESDSEGYDSPSYWD